MLVNVWEYNKLERSFGITDWYMHMLPGVDKLEIRLRFIGKTVLSAEEPTICSNGVVLPSQGSFANTVPFETIIGKELYRGT
jgi:hypothetical protein